MLTTMDRATATRAAVLALRNEIDRLSIDTLGDVAREIAEIDGRINPIDVACTVASEIEREAREKIPHLPFLDPELLVEGCTMRDLFALRRGDLRIIGGALGAQLGAVYEVQHAPGLSDWIGTMDLAEINVSDVGLLEWLGHAKVGDRFEGMVKRIA
jgi:hypothetical protein